MQTQELQRPAPDMARPPEPQPRGFPLGQVTVSLTVLAVGILGLVDLSGAKVAGSAYFALALAVIGLGLMTGAWYGRARWLFVIGLILTPVVAATAIAEAVGPVNSRSVTWRPASIDQLESTYKIDLGNATLDLTRVDFVAQNKSIRVDVGAGNLTIIVPPNVDVRTEATVDVGNANVFGTHWGGVGQDGHTVADNGADGPGGGQLLIQASVDVGNLEVKR